MCLRQLLLVIDQPLLVSLVLTYFDREAEFLDESHVALLM